MAFGAELKDFISAYSAGKKMFSTTDEEYKRLQMKVMQQKLDDGSDPEMKALKKKVLQRQANAPHYRPDDPSASRLRDAQAEYWRRRKELLDVPKDGNDGPATLPPPSAPPNRTSALPTYGTDVADLQQDYQPEDVGFVAAANKGGVIKPVRNYALGGAVDDIKDDDGTDDSPDLVDDADEDNIAEANASVNLGFSPQAAIDATLAGLRHAQVATGVTSHASQARAQGIPTNLTRSSAPSGATAYLRGAGAASPRDMEAIYKKIDKDNKMSESERNLAALSMVWEWKLQQGDLRGAQAAAGSIVQYMRVVSDRYAALAKVAAGNGDVDGTLRALAKAHANVPDGVDLKFKRDEKTGKISYEFMDTQSGKVTERGVTSPEELLQWATRGGIKDFDSLIVQAGGQRQSNKAAPQGPKKISDRKAAMALVTDVEGVELKDKDLAPTIKYAASQIVGDNEVDGRTAYQIVDTLTDPTTADKVKYETDKDGATVAKLPGGRTVRLTREALQNLGELRLKTLAKKSAAFQKDQEDKEREEERRVKIDEKNKSRDLYFANRRQKALDNRMSLDRMPPVEKKTEEAPAANERSSAIPTSNNDPWD